MTSIRHSKFKLVVALILSVALLLMPFSVSALAAGPEYLSSNGLLSQRFAAWVAAAISAISISLDAINAPIADMANFIADPFNVVYTYPEAQLNSYLDQNVISITPNGTEISGVMYDDVWLSADAANKFRTNAFDFQTAYSIASNTNGTFASGTGTSFGLPFYAVGNTIRCPTYTFAHNHTAQTYSLGDLTLSFEPSQSYWGTLRIYRNGTQVSSCTYNTTVVTQFYLRYFANNTSFRPEVDGYTGVNFSGDPLNDPFEFDYTAGTIPVNSPIPSDEGLLIHVPRPSGTSHFEQFIQDYPEYTQPGGVTIDITDPDTQISLDDLADILIPIINIINSEVAPQPDTPVPPSPGSIADTQYSVLDTTLQQIRESLNNIIQSITTIPSSIQTATQSIVQAISSIPSAISSLGDRILEDIEIGPIKVFDKALDLIRSIFSPVFALIASGLSIWSYVVQWFGSLSAPLAFMFNVLPAAVWSPVYALIAGTICIAIFRRFK